MSGPELWLSTSFQLFFCQARSCRASFTERSPMSSSVFGKPRCPAVDLALLQAIYRPTSRAQLIFRRANSSDAPKVERKLPSAAPPRRLTPWQRNFLVGICVGTVTVVVYQIYEWKRVRDAFVAYKIVSKEPVSSTASIFRLEPLEKSQNFEIYKNAWRRGIWNVHFKQPQIQIVRPYTPLPPSESALQDGEGILRFLIRRDPHGEVSSYLHALPVGSKIELRGPNLEYEIDPAVQQVVFFAGGTGIAPALQVAHALFDADGDKNGRKLHILWANRHRGDCIGGYSDAPPAEPVPPKPSWSGFLTPKRPKPQIPLTQDRGLVVQELEELKAKYPGQVTVEYFVNDEETWIDRDAVFKALSRFDDKDFSSGSPTAQEQRQILISGSNGFISYLAGPKEWKGGRETQGSVSHILAHAISMNPHNVKIWKI
jgi:NAD(P)H-flavin reductase